MSIYTDERIKTKRRAVDIAKQKSTAIESEIAKLLLRKSYHDKEVEELEADIERMSNGG